LLYHFAHAGRSSALRAVHGQKGFHQGHGDLVGLKRHHCTVAADDLVVVQRMHGRSSRAFVGRQIHQARGGGGNIQIDLNGHF
jgi:hypothetical protein